MKKTLILLLSLLIVQGYCPVLLAQQTTPEKQEQLNTEAFRKALKGAQAGNYFSMDEVVARYRAGNGTSIDYGKAMYWYRKRGDEGGAVYS